MDETVEERRMELFLGTEVREEYLNWELGAGARKLVLDGVAMEREGIYQLEPLREVCKELGVPGY